MNSENITGFKLEKGKSSQTTKIDYFVPELNRSRIDVIEDQPHIDLIQALSGLNSYLASIFHANEKDAGTYEITGFKYSGNKVILTGKMMTADCSIVGIATPGIDIDGDSYGFEEELSEKLAVLVIEVHHFLTGKKTGVKQLTIDDQIQGNSFIKGIEDGSITVIDNEEYTQEQFDKELDEEEKMDNIDFALTDNDE